MIEVVVVVVIMTVASLYKHGINRVVVALGAAPVLSLGFGGVGGGSHDTDSGSAVAAAAGGERANGRDLRLVFHRY